MLLPVYAYGHPVLREIAKPIAADDPLIKSILENMWETMYNAKGVGLAAPQVGMSIRVFVVDTLQLKKGKEKATPGIKKVFINAQKIEETGTKWSYEEGCLSIPDINGEVDRPSNIRIKYMDENFVEHEEEFDGFEARVIQHEYDHIEGILFIDYLNPLKKKLIARKLENIRTGKISSFYRLKFAKI
jgi:peptide deformylase